MSAEFIVFTFDVPFRIIDVKPDWASCGSNNCWRANLF